MEDYKSKYEVYKESLLRSHYLRDKIREGRKNTLCFEKDYIDRNGVLPKIGVLSAVGGFCYALCFSLVQLDEAPGVILRALLAVVGTVCFFWAGQIGAAFKEASGKSNFYSFEYDRYIEDRVLSDREAEANNLVRDFLSQQIDREEFKKRYDELSMYGRFAKDLKNDYDFNTEIQESF